MQVKWNIGIKRQSWQAVVYGTALQILGFKQILSEGYKRC